MIKLKSLLELTIKEYMKKIREDAWHGDIEEPWDDKDIEYQRRKNLEPEDDTPDPDEVRFKLDPRVNRIGRGGMGRQPRTSSKFDNGAGMGGQRLGV